MAWPSVRTNKTLTGTEARQGFLDRPVLAVLVVSLVLAAFALGAAFFGLWQAATARVLRNLSRVLSLFLQTRPLPSVAPAPGGIHPLPPTEAVRRTNSFAMTD